MEENSSDSDAERMEAGEDDNFENAVVAIEDGGSEAEFVSAQSVSESESNDEEEEQQFDITLAAYHSYMGPGMTTVSGRRVLEAGWAGRVPVWAHHGVVFPGETVPVLRVEVNHTPDAVALQAIHKDKLFGLLCPDETGTMVSGYGVLCEVFEASVTRGRPSVTRRRAWQAGLGGAARAGAGEREELFTRTFKARATHRFRLVDMPKHSMPIHGYERMRFVEVRVLPEVAPDEPLRLARLGSLDHHRTGNTQLDCRLRSMDAALTPWPLFVYDIFDYARMRRYIADYFLQFNLTKLPFDAVSLSCWVASNLALSARDRLALFVVDNALLRLHMEVRLIARRSMLCCSVCKAEIARREHVIAMSSDGVHSNYTNPGGYMHDIVTVSRVSHTALEGPPSAVYSWFPGYTWTIAHCDSCTQHVGWRFDAMRRNLRPQQFYGLCRNTVQPCADTDPAPEL